MLVAVIGSRHLPPEALQFCEWVGRRLVERGHQLITGNAPGADQAYARGANAVDPGAVILCLPWEGFERQSIAPGNELRFASLAGPAAQEAAMASPGWREKSQGARLLLTRDVLIVGPAEAVIAYPGPAANGTRFTMALAKRRGLTVCDVSLEPKRRLLERRLGEEKRA